MSKKVLITSRSFGKISNEPLDILTKAGFEVTMKGKDFDQAEFEAMILEYDALIIGAHDVSGGGHGALPQAENHLQAWSGPG